METIDWKEYNHLLIKEEIAPRTILLNEGEIAKKLIIIEKGCIRSWFNNNGKDITFQFFTEGQIVASINSFKTNQPSLFTIESIESSVVYYIPKQNLDRILNESLEIKTQFENLTFDRLITYQKLFLSRIKDNPEKRYLMLLESQPEIILRIPQHYIASYLGITPVSLSRIRNRKPH